MAITSRFRTPEAAERFLAAYNTTLALWRVKHEVIEVETSFGKTHLNVAGSPELPPLILLHGAQIGSPVWYANISALSHHFRVYAPDVIDQMGRSLPIRKLKTAQDCATWLTEVLDKLGLERVSLVGHSQGGWQALNMALNAPKRVERLALLSPSGSLGRMRWQFLFKMLPVFVRPNKKSFYRAFQWLTTQPLGDQHPLAEQFMIGAQAFKPSELRLGVVSVFSDAALRSLEMPVLLLIGKQDGTCRPTVELERARRLIPQLTTALILHGGHLFPVDQAEVTNAHLLAFLAQV